MVFNRVFLLARRLVAYPVGRVHQEVNVQVKLQFGCPFILQPDVYRHVFVESLEKQLSLSLIVSLRWQNNLRWEVTISNVVLLWATRYNIPAGMHSEFPCSCTWSGIRGSSYSGPLLRHFTSLAPSCVVRVLQSFSWRWRATRLFSAVSRVSVWTGIGCSIFSWCLVATEGSFSFW